MSTPLLETKLHAPRSRHGLIARPRLRARLESRAASKLTLVSAPPGFGKTTLVSDWLAGLGPEVAAAWLSLDTSDDDGTTFWTYVVAAIRSVAPSVGDHAMAAFETLPQRADVAIQSLLNELATLQHDVVLVLDDFHVIASPDVVQDLTFFLDHLPRNVRVVITTRADPALPVPRMRARGELVEVRAADLRFTAEEAAAFLNQTMDLALSADDVAALEARTEGWIAGLQLAALSIQGRDDVASFIASFAGDDRYIVDYLVDEVLARQTDDVRGFLLDTAVLERLTAPLCDAVTGRDDSQRMLEALDRANLFVVALDDQRTWYRYHHLFADVLRSRLIDERPDDVPALHRRASEWFEQRGDESEAIAHALAGGDFERAASLIELAHPALGRTRGELTLRRWLDALPQELLERRPVLAAGYAGVLMQMGEIARVGHLLGAAERSLAAADDERVVVDRERLAYLPAQLAMYRAALARIHGDLPSTMTHARRALELADPRDHLGRGGPAALLGLATWETGDLDDAYRWFAEGMASLEAGGFVADVVGGAVTLADIRIAQGRLSDAMRIYQRGLELATAHTPALRGAADMHVGMGAVLRERNSLVAAAEHLAASQELGDENGLPKNPGRSRIAAARLRQADGDLDGALDLLADAERHFFSDFSPDAQPISAIRARLWIAQGRLAEARAWARERELTPDDELTYLREYEHATLARLMFAEASRDRADDRLPPVVALCTRLVEYAGASGRNGAVLDALVVLALAHHALRDVSPALGSLSRAIELAEPEGYVRVFVDEGAPMTALLAEAAKRAPSNGYLSALHAAATVPRPRSTAQGLIEPLSERELDVLRLLATELSGPEIAQHLYVSLNTVRTHTKNVFSKLNVNSRRAAVRRGEELDLLTRS